MDSLIKSDAAEQTDFRLYSIDSSLSKPGTFNAHN